ncbi:MAG: type II secretion system F family protein [Candidatus Paceibacterota bacterium]|nr:MAG: type II secretion system F family protein [Candidatus Paceibacterota bacterium]
MEFLYQAKDQTGRVLQGVVDAPNEGIAVDTLHNKGLTLLSIQSAKKPLVYSDIGLLFSKPKQKDIVIFTRQLATLIEAEMPLAEGLRTLAKQTEKKTFQKIINDIADSVESGVGLADSMNAHVSLFSPFYVKLVKSGEISGKLQESLQYLADYLERSYALTAKLKGALAYPAFIIFAMAVVVIIMMTYVLPQLLVVFEEAGNIELPLQTRLLIATSNFMTEYIVYILVALVLGAVGLWRYIKTPTGRVQFDALQLRVPGFGKIFRNVYLSRIAEIFSTLIKSGVGILDAIKLVADLVGNKSYEALLLKVEQTVRGGGGVATTLAENPTLIPALMSSMVAIGEKTGKLDSMLTYVAKFYRAESESSVQSISSLVEPVLMLFLGFGVAVLVSAILLPLYSLTAQ